VGFVTRIVCLANSRKRDGHCVAGLELDENGKLGRRIRPVGPRESESLTPDERRYPDGTEPQLLDVIEMTLLERFPCGHQTENYRPHPGRPWKRIGKLSCAELAPAVQKFPGSLWFDGRRWLRIQRQSTGGQTRGIFIFAVAARAGPHPHRSARGRQCEEEKGACRSPLRLQTLLLPVTDPVANAISRVADSENFPALRCRSASACQSRIPDLAVHATNWWRR